MPEIFGVHEHIKDVCRRLAKAGYMAIAPELFARQGDVTKMSDSGAIMKEVVAKVPDEQVMRDLDATIEWARRSGALDGDRVGITGFCWGGRIVWLYCARTGSAGTPRAGALQRPHRRQPPRSSSTRTRRTRSTPTIALRTAGRTRRTRGRRCWPG